MHIINNNVKSPNSNSGWLNYNQTGKGNKTHLIIHLIRGDTLTFKALFKESLYPKQYGKFTGYYLS